MSYIGNIPTTVAFLVDTFSGNGSTTAFTLSQAPANTSSILVAVSGVVQDPSTYSVSGTTLTFSGAPPSGTSNISVRFLGIPASGVATTAYRTVTEFTATSGQTTFSVPSYTVGYIDVYRNGVLLGSADYTATNGTTVVLNNGCTAGDLVETISFFVSSVLNAIPAVAGAVNSNYIANDVTINFADGSASTPSITNNGDTNTGIFFPAADTIAFAEGGAEVARFDSSGNLNLGTSTTNRLLFAYNGVDGEATIGPNSTGGSTLLTLGTSNSGTYAERMRIDNSGNLMVATTNPNDDAGRGFKVRPTSQGTSVTCTQDTNAGFTTYHVFNLNATNNGYRFYVKINGGIDNFSGNNGNLSDERLKTNIELSGNYLNKICSIPVKLFNYKDEPEGEQRTLGVIAQDVEAVAPELVSNDGFGEIPEDGIPLKTIYQTDLTFALMKCIQEQQAIITDLKSRIEALEAK